MNFASQARADWRVLVSAAVIGSGVGMTLGAAYMAGGMAQAATDHSRATRIAQAADGAFSDGVLLSRAAGDDAGVLRLAQAVDPFARSGEALERDRQADLMEGLQRAELRRRPTQVDRTRELDCLTQAVYFEARGEDLRGQAAVAQVVLNRVKNPNFPKTVCGVVFQGAAARHGCQFSFACDGSMRRGLERGAWDRARRVAARALAGVVVADIGSATHYHTVSVSPAWGFQMKKVAQVGLHVFYRFNPKAKLQTERPVFVSAPLDHTPTLRLSNAVVVEGPADASGAAGKPAMGAEAGEKPAQPLAGSAPPAGLARAAEAVAKPASATETTAS